MDGRRQLILLASSVTENPKNDLAIYIVIMVIAGVVLAALVITLGLLIYKRKAKPKQVIEKTEQIFENNIQEIKTEDKYMHLAVGKLHNVGKRTSQQDSFAVSDEKDMTLCKEKGLIAIVADGMGGLKDGDKISSIITLSLLKNFYEKKVSENPLFTLLEMLKMANEEVNVFLKDKKERCGSTLVTGIIKNHKLYWLSVGDSRIYLYRQKSLILLNREHTYREELDLKFVNGEITKEEAVRHEQKGALTSYIGMGKLEKIDKSFSPVELKKGDRIIFASDGVFGTMGDEQMASVMQYPLEESIRMMNEWIVSVGKKNQDNYTAVIIECR